MKRFSLSILFVTVFFLGVGALIEKTTAKFKSDEKALELIRKARQAIGGDAAITNVKALRISGRTTHKFNADGTTHSETGDTQLSFTVGGPLMRSDSFGNEAGAVRRESRSVSREVTVTSNEPSDMKVRLGKGEGSGTGVGAAHIIIKKDDGTVQELSGADAEKFIAEHHGEVAGEHRIIIKKDDGTVNVIVGDGAEKVGDKASNGVVLRKMDHGGTATFESKDGKTVVESGNVLMRHPGPEGGMFMRHPGPEGAIQKNGMLRLTLGLLMSSPEGTNVDYTYAGEADVDGTACNVVIAATENQSYKIFLSKSTDLPVALGYSGPSERVMTFTATLADAGESKDGVTTFNMKVPAPADGKERVMTFKSDAPASGDAKGNYTFKRIGDSVDHMVKFSDYRTVNGVQLPYKWTTTGGDQDETFEVTTYEVNPANISMKVAEPLPRKVKIANDH